MRKIVIFGLILGTALLLAGCRNPLTGEVVTLPLIEKHPAEVLQLMQQQLVQDQTFTAVTDANLAATGGTEPLSSSTLDQHVSATVDRVGGRAALTSRMSLGLAGSSYDVASENFYGNGKLYFRFTQLPLLPFFNLQTVQNVWFVRDLTADTQGLKNDLRIDDAALRHAAPQIEALVANASMFSVQERLLDEPVDTINAYHYRVTLNGAGVTSFAQGLYQTLQPAIPALKDKTFNSTSFEQFLASIRSARIEFWIGKGDYRLRKFSVAGTYDQGSERLQYVVTTTLSRFGEAFTTAAPTDAKPADDFAKQLDLTKLQDQLKTLLPLLGGSLTPEQLQQLQRSFF